MIICWQNNNHASQRIYCRSLLRMKLLSFDKPYAPLDSFLPNLSLKTGLYEYPVCSLPAICFMLGQWETQQWGHRWRFNQATRSRGPPSSRLCVPVTSSFSLLQSRYLSYHLALGTCRAYQYPLVSSLSSHHILVNSDFTGFLTN